MRRLFFYLVCAVFFTGCARQADTGNPVRFTEGALTFDYPGNWKVSTNDPLGEGRLVMLEEPGSALLTVTAFAPGMEVSLKDYGANLKENMTDSTLGLLMNIKSRGVRQENEALELKFTVSVAGVRVPHTQEVTRHVFGNVTVFCMSQVSDEDRHLVQAGFDLVRGSLQVMDRKTTASHQKSD